MARADRLVASDVPDRRARRLLEQEISMATKVALVTGGSSGIGEATAVQLQQHGYTTYAAARRVERMEGLADRDIRPLAMDVTDDQSTQTAVERILGEAGRVDVLVNNAGYGSYGPVEDVPLSEAWRQFDVNVFGAARLIQLVLPHMREQRDGTIVNLTSMGGRIYTPLGGWYHASKFALEALSDCLRMEVAPFGIDVVVIEPGGIRTEWGDIAAEHLEEVSRSGPYSEQAAAVVESLRSETTRRRSSPPDLIAKTIVKAVSARRPKTRYAVGYGAKPLILAHDVLPNRAFDAVMRRATGVPSP
jgi:NAD(P)-dependent dehydrogenase (short-subunit alcohol dehydrogenase family)